MKTLKIFFLALTMGGLVGLGSCSKDDSFTPAKKGTPQFALDPSVSTITINPNPVNVGNSVDITASVSPVPVSGGLIQVQQARDAFNNPTSSASAATWVTVVQDAGTAGSVVYTIASASAADNNVGYRAHFAPAGSGFAESQSAGADLVVEESCSGMSLAATLASVSGNEFTVEYTLTVCENMYGVKLQGGLTAGATLISANGASAVKNTKQNTIITWNLGDLAPGVTTYTVVFTKSLTGSGPWKLTGDWSANGKDGSNNQVTAGYNNAVVYELP